MHYPQMGCHIPRQTSFACAVLHHANRSLFLSCAIFRLACLSCLRPACLAAFGQQNSRCVRESVDEMDPVDRLRSSRSPANDIEHGETSGDPQSREQRPWDDARPPSLGLVTAGQQNVLHGAPYGSHEASAGPFESMSTPDGCFFFRRLLGAHAAPGFCQCTGRRGPGGRMVGSDE